MKPSLAYYTSDTHFGSDKMAISRGFQSADDFFQQYKIMHNSMVMKQTVIVIAGDVAKEGHEHLLEGLRGQLYFVLGNHDNYKQLQKYGKITQSIQDKHLGILVTHQPIHPQELRWANFNIHGHVHKATIKDPRYINLCFEEQGLKLKTIKELLLT